MLHPPVNADVPIFVPAQVNFFGQRAKNSRGNNLKDKTGFSISIALY
jgi:hypothetical protein